MSYRCTLRGETHSFADLRELLAKANEEKSGDALAGIAARSATERVAHSGRRASGSNAELSFHADASLSQTRS